MESLCVAHGVSLRAAALQFSLQEPRVTSTIVGTASPEHVAELIKLITDPFPDGLLAELAPLAAPAQEWLG
jgi:D-threo-aldose 1-dehydrogenase